jgi:hypothetical protein
MFLYTSTLLNSDEGMWTFDNIPIDTIQKKYGFKIDSKFLDKLRLSSVRFNDGGSGSFVSEDGLAITNHHVAIGQLQKLSTKTNDLVKNGFYAKSKTEELKCSDLELNILVEFENVSESVFSVLLETDSEKVKLKKMKEQIAKIEKESQEKTGYRSDVVELYNGGEYWLYKFKKYTDIRLVMSPESQLASFGGDTDNFNYPRFALDFTFFRVYENNKPIKVKNFLKWTKKSVKENELVFVSGHPGSTDRERTLSELIYDKDFIFPETIRNIESKLEKFKEFSKKGKEEARQANEIISGLENSHKALKGEWEGLKNPEILQKIKSKEDSLKEKINSNDSLKKEFANAFEKIENAQNKLIIRFKKFYYTSIGSSKLLNYALKIVRYSIEKDKPNEKRYEEYRDSSIDSLKLKLFSKAPIYNEVEKIHFKFTLENISEQLDKNDPFRKNALEEEIDSQVERLIDDSKISDMDFRKNLFNLSYEELKKVDDPLLQYIIKLEPYLREERDWYESNIESVMTVQGKKINDIKFKLYGKTVYPDATFTLRLSYGKIKGYLDTNQISVPFRTTYYGLFDRAHSFSLKEEFSLTKKIISAQNKINLSTQLNFISTNDITGGNSGSPVVNSKLEFVGIIFDGNSHSHILNYFYEDEFSRAVSVDAMGIIEALDKIYQTKPLLKELGF